MLILFEEARMLVGLDLDNTIIKYDELFHSLALEKGLIPEDLAVSKALVCDYVRRRHSEDEWQRLQALAYGPRLKQAKIFYGARQAMERWIERGLKLVIISHKTHYSACGDHELRVAALDFLDENGIITLILKENIHFASEMDEKVGLIAKLKCGIFVDDLPKILLHPGFPADTGRILFDSSGKKNYGEGIKTCVDWAQIEQSVLDYAEKQREV